MDNTKNIKTKPPMNAIDLENFILQHIAVWVEEAVKRTDGETKNFYECPELFRDKMDRFTNSVRNKWFAYEKHYKLKSKYTK